MRNEILKWVGAVAIGLNILFFAALKSDISNIQIQGNQPVGGITRVAINTGTKWITSLVPSASFTVNLGSATLPVNNYFGVGASFSGNINWLGELKPDGVLCANGQILKKTAANDWDCAADATGVVGSASANFGPDTNNVYNLGTIRDYNWKNGYFGTSLGINYGSALDTSLEVGGTASISGVLSLRTGINPLANLTTASSSFNWNWGATNFFNQGIIYPKFVEATNFGSATSPSFSWTGDGNTGFYRNGDGGLGFSSNGTVLQWNGSNFLPNNSGTKGLGTLANQWGNLFTTNASVSANFEVLGYASISGKFTQISAASNSFGGSIEPKTSGIGSLGTTALKWSQVVANLIQAVINFILPTSSSTSNTIATSTAGSEIMNTASKSLDFSDGTTQYLLMAKRCFTYVYPTPTKITRWAGKRFDDPFTLLSVAPVASGSNASTWNLYYATPGTTGTGGTAVFTAPKKASTSAYPTYKTSGVGAMNNFTIKDGDQLDIVITSASATLQQINLNVCGFYNK